MKPRRRERAEAINWARVRQRLAQAIELTEGAEKLSPARARAVLDERARALARLPEATAPAATVESLAFDLGGERFALDTAHVREVIRHADLTPLPGAGELVAGVTNLRGQILTVFDVRTLFGAARAEGAAGQGWVVVLGAGRAELGIVADAVREVVALRVDQVLEPEALPAGATRDCVRGVTAEGLLVLDGAALLRDARLFVDQGEDGGA